MQDYGCNHGIFEMLLVPRPSFRCSSTTGVLMYNLLIESFYHRSDEFPDNKYALQCTA
jgi:hypothetical protein